MRDDKTKSSEVDCSSFRCLTLATFSSGAQVEVCEKKKTLSPQRGVELFLKDCLFKSYFLMIYFETWIWIKLLQDIADVQQEILFYKILLLMVSRRWTRTRPPPAPAACVFRETQALTFFP
ncbi:unnamed protein product [Amoebophrya sp. A120]|nr:unnamed protein product [Amoebophrya sp. A120]|eukprot:GSA120T00004453001.1